MGKIKNLLLTTLIAIVALCCIAPVEVSAKTVSVDSTLAVPPIFANSAYAVLNPQTAADCNYDVAKMYNYYMKQGVKEGQRLFATPALTTYEELFLYMSNNRKLYVSKGLNSSFPYFNVNNYIACNPDLVAVFGTNMQMYLYHYINFGIYEGRTSGTLFDPARAIEFNYALASLNNASLNPEKIYSNYAAVTGVATTANLTTKIANGNLVATVPTTTVTTQTSACCPHDWEYIDLEGEGQHKKRCRKCCYVEGKSDHNYECKGQTCGGDSSMHELKCKDCRRSIGDAHRDDNNDGKCDVCGYTVGTTHTHVYNVMTTGYTDTEHTMKCSCGSTVQAAHNLSGGSCACGYVAPSPHSHSYTYTSNGNGTHNGTCSCNTEPISNEACDTNGENGKCSKCGYTPTP